MENFKPRLELSKGAIHKLIKHLPLELSSSGKANTNMSIYLVVGSDYEPILLSFMKRTMYESSTCFYNESIQRLLTIFLQYFCYICATQEVMYL